MVRIKVASCASFLIWAGFIAVLPATCEPVARLQAIAHPVVVSAIVQADAQPVPNALVVAIGREYAFRVSQHTGADGRCTLKLMGGHWAFFAYAHGLLVWVPDRVLERDSEQVLLEPRGVCRLTATSKIAGVDTEGATVTATEVTTGQLGPIADIGAIQNGELWVRVTPGIMARIGLARGPNAQRPGLFWISEPVMLGIDAQVVLSTRDSALANFHFRGLRNEPVWGHLQFHADERSFCWSPSIWDFPDPDVCIVVSPHPMVVLRGLSTGPPPKRWHFRFNHQVLRLAAGEEDHWVIGGPLQRRVFTTPRAADEFKPATQVCLLTTDGFGNVMIEVWPPGSQRQSVPHLRVEAAGERVEADFNNFCGKVLREFPPATDPRCYITFDQGPFGRGMLTGRLYDEACVRQTFNLLPHVLVQSPGYDSPFHRAHAQELEDLAVAMQALLGVPYDSIHGVINNILHHGFEDEVLHGYKLEFALEFMEPPEWPSGDGFLAHEAGHGCEQRGPAHTGVVSAEPYATLIGYRARAARHPDPRLFDFLMGQHDLFMLRLHDPGLRRDRGGEIEMFQFVTYFVDKHYGWPVHRRILLEWEHAFAGPREALGRAGFNDMEQCATAYSRICGANLAPVFRLAGFPIEDTRIDAALRKWSAWVTSADPVVRVPDEIPESEHTSVALVLQRRPAAGYRTATVELSADPQRVKFGEVRCRDLSFDPTCQLSVTRPSPGRLVVTITAEHGFADMGTLAQVDLRFSPGVSGTVPIQVKASVDDRTVAASGARLTLDRRPMIIDLPLLPDASSGRDYQHQLTALGGTPPYRWEAVEGSLPKGLRLHLDGQLSGRTEPHVLGSWQCRVRCTDAAGASRGRVFQLTVR